VVATSISTPLRTPTALSAKVIAGSGRPPQAVNPEIIAVAKSARAVGSMTTLLGIDRAPYGPEALGKSCAILSFALRRARSKKRNLVLTAMTGRFTLLLRRLATTGSVQAPQ
jgi:hypothetical protein